MVCDKCGNELKEGAQFCDKCGKKVKSNNGTKKSNKLPFIIISIIVVIAVIIGFIIINKDNTSKEININTTSGINASKELIREDSTAPRGVTYNFKLEDVKRAMDNACKENNTNNYLDFEYSRSQNNVDFYESYKDETKNDGCLVSVMVYNDYVIGISFIYYEDMIEELNQNRYNVFFNILRDNYNADYSNKIKSILDNLGNEKHEYFDNTICYKEIQDNFGTTEYSIIASSLESYNELEGVTSNTTENKVTTENNINYINKENFINELEQSDKEHIKKYIQNKYPELQNDDNFVENRFEIVGNEIIYVYLYVSLKQANGVTVYTYLEANYYSVEPILKVPENWKELDLSKLNTYFWVTALEKGVAVKQLQGTGLTDEQISNAIAESNPKINENISKYKDLVNTPLSKDEQESLARFYLRVIEEYKKPLGDGYLVSSIPTKEDTNKYKDYYCKVVSKNKVLYIDFLRRTYTAKNYKDSDSKEYCGMGVLIDINPDNIPIYFRLRIKNLSLHDNLSISWLQEFPVLLLTNALPSVSETTFVTTPVKKNPDTTGYNNLSNEFITYICNYFGV